MKKSTILLKFSHRILHRSSQIFKMGGLVIFPTDTVYGIGALMKNKKAINQIYRLRHRPKNKALLILIASKKDLNKYVHLNLRAKKIINKLWPGPLTIILSKKKTVPNFITARQSTVAIRLPENKFLRILIKKLGQPIVAPSANLSGKKSPLYAQETFKDFWGKVDLILDGGRTKYQKESTLLDLTKNPPVILRAGAMAKNKIEKYLL
jgi:L-threonylcarbamoyladenylate synthase